MPRAERPASRGRPPRPMARRRGCSQRARRRLRRRRMAMDVDVDDGASVPARWMGHPLRRASIAGGAAAPPPPPPPPRLLALIRRPTLSPAGRRTATPRTPCRAPSTCRFPFGGIRGASSPCSACSRTYRSTPPISTPSAAASMASCAPAGGGAVAGRLAARLLGLPSMCSRMRTVTPRRPRRPRPAAAVSVASVAAPAGHARRRGGAGGGARARRALV